MSNAINDEIELVFLQDNPMQIIQDKDRPKGHFFFLPMRTNFDKLWYGTGSAYATGLTMGGLYGAIRGWQLAPVPLFKVRWNSMINQTTRYGPKSANALGVLTVAWACLDSLFGSIREKEDYYNHVGAAFCAGYLYKSTAGVRPAFLTGLTLTAVVSAYGAVDKYVLKQ